jgi:glycosyltransferase involved in cell wall biosynthesis
MVKRPSVVALLGAETAKVPSIGYGYLQRPIVRRLVLTTCAAASAVVVISGQQEETLRQHGFRKNVEVIPFGVEPAMFEFQRKRASSPLRILHVANLTEVKDQATLIRGFALLKRHVDAVLRIVGPDYLNGRLQRLTAELGLEDRVEFVGAVSYATIPVHYRWADLFVLTSLCEAQNSALTEAAMSGVLLVSTPVGCIHDLGDDAAVIVRIGDPVDLAEKIRTIVKDPVEWQKKVALARAWAERHDLLWTVERLREVIDGVREWR